MQKENEHDMDLFRAIFRNTDSEDSSSSDEEETKKDSSLQDDIKDRSEKMETETAAGDPNPRDVNLPTGNIVQYV